MVIKKSIFTNEDDFDFDDALEIDEKDFKAEDYVELPISVKPGTAEIIEKLTGDVPKEAVYFLPEHDTKTETPVVERPTKLSVLKNCPRCSSLLVHAIAINGSESVSFKECPSCGTLVNTFEPIEYQAVVAARAERYIMLAGGFGSGKSRINIEMIISHLLLIPNARVVVAAKTYPSIAATFVKDFFAIMPLRLLRKKNEMKHEWIFTNGSELLLRSFDNPVKLRGINATMFVLLEASNIPYEGFKLAQNRIRNTAALITKFDSKGNPVFKYDVKAKAMRPVYAHDARKILIETNPDAGWVKKKFLIDSSEVHYYGSAHKEGYRMREKLDPNKFTLVMATDANPYLPEKFIEEQTRDKSVAYVQQFFYGSFNFSENLVYPNAGAVIVPSKPLPLEFNEQGQRVLWYVIGLDYGISDALSVIYGAYSSITKKLYIFDELYERGLDIKTAVKKHREKMKLHKITNEKLMLLPLFDGRSYNKREANLETIGSLFNNEGLYFTPSFTFNDARIAKLNGIINEAQIEIYSNVDFLIEEITNYKYKLNRDGTSSDKPVDKNNHAINALEFIIMALPINLEYCDMSVYLPEGTRHKHDEDEGIKDIDLSKQVFNPYKGGSNNGRNTTRHINNRYGRHRGTALPKLKRQSSEDEEEGNIFQAYVPGRS